MGNESYQALQKDNALWNLGFNVIKELETDLGILASGKNEIYGCIFGRDSLITSLKLLKVYENTGDAYFLTLVKKVLRNLSILQGKEINIESGEEPGKCIHEYRPANHEHLTKNAKFPWYIYPDNIMRNFDSVDSTPLFLITAYRYWQISKDDQFMSEILPNIRLAIDWILKYSDNNNDGFIDYWLNPERKHGGLTTQSWMDSRESVFHEDGTTPSYPIAPVEAQSYAFLALRLWSNYFAATETPLSEHLDSEADRLKKRFNETFTIREGETISLAAGIDGAGKLLTSARSSMGHCLWASLEEIDGGRESIISDEFIPAIVNRLLSPDLFAPQAGIRTLSTSSRAYSPQSYHNGSIWPHDTSIVAGGFEIFGFKHEADQVRRALISALTHFNTPIELFVYADDKFSEYLSPLGQGACKKQAWSAAALLKEVLFTAVA